MKNDSTEQLLETLRLPEVAEAAKIPSLDIESGLVETLSVQDVFSNIEERFRLPEVAEAAKIPSLDIESGLVETLSVQDVFSNIEERFRLPEVAEAAKIPSLDIESGLVETLSMQDVFSNIEERFRLPEVAEAAKIPSLDIESGLVETLSMQDVFSNIEERFRLPEVAEAAKIPSLDIESGLVETLSMQDVFSNIRDRISWPADIYTDSLARTSFYLERGLDPDLTAFPPEAFEQIVSTAGLKGSPPPLIYAYNLEPEVEEGEESAFRRTNKAHDRLQRFETQLRRFIDERMKTAFGENWIKHQVSGEIRKQWLEKKQKARESGEPEWPLIAYADFTDYEKIITRGDNWKKVFKPVFKRSSSVQESFQRLYPIRRCTMHARPVTQDGELYLYVEVKRILNAIGIVI